MALRPRAVVAPARIAAALAPDGVLIYETFALGNERFGRPRNPDFLLRPGELIDAFAALWFMQMDYCRWPSPIPDAHWTAWSSAMSR